VLRPGDLPHQDGIDRAVAGAVRRHREGARRDDRGGLLDLEDVLAAFSDYHGTGANPAANAAYVDAAFVANRFRVVTSRRHI